MFEPIPRNIHIKLWFFSSFTSTSALFTYLVSRKNSKSVISANLPKAPNNIYASFEIQISASWIFATQISPNLHPSPKNCSSRKMSFFAKELQNGDLCWFSYCSPFQSFNTRSSYGNVILTMRVILLFSRTHHDLVFHVFASASVGWLNTGCITLPCVLKLLLLSFDCKNKG